MANKLFEVLMSSCYKQPTQMFASLCFNLLFMPGPLTLKERRILLKGKLRRFYYLTFHKDYVDYCLSLRQSDCGRSGACCNLAFPCPNLGYTEEDHLPYCKIRDYRPESCRVFPIDWQDLEERDIVSKKTHCGYKIPSKEQNNFQKFQEMKKAKKASSS